jgi:hypothetical protein
LEGTSTVVNRSLLFATLFVLFVLDTPIGTAIIGSIAPWRISTTWRKR